MANRSPQENCCQNCKHSYPSCEDFCDMYLEEQEKRNVKMRDTKRTKIKNRDIW